MKKQILLVVSILLLGFSIISAQTPKTISGGVLNGKAQNLPAPEYPAAAKAVKAGGAVNVQVTIDEEGNVSEASAVSGHPLLRKAAVDAALQAKFSPTTLSGQAVKVTGVVIYNFTPSPLYTVSDQPPTTYTGGGNAITGDRTPPAKSDNTISGGVVNGKARNLVVPAYPAAARAVNAEGAVNVQVVIDEIGSVTSASAVSGHPLLRSAAEQAAWASKFSPTMLQGQPVRVTGIIIYNFVGNKPAPGNEEKLKVMGLGAYLTMFKEMEDSQPMGKEELPANSEIAREIELLGSITTQTSKDDRIAILNKVSAAVEGKLSGADAWQFQLGKNFGEVLLQLPGTAANNGEFMDETAVRTNLLKMRDSLFSAPANFPPDVLSKLKELTKFADVQNLNSPDNTSRLKQMIMETLNLISPDAAK